MKYLRLYEEHTMFRTLSNLEMVSIISHFANKLKSYTERDMKDHFHYKESIKGLNELKGEIKERIKRDYKSEETEIGKISSDVIRDILREEGRLDFSVGMWKTILKTIDETIKNNKLTVVVEDGDDYVLYDEEKEYLYNLFKKYEK